LASLGVFHPHLVATSWRANPRSMSKAPRDTAGVVSPSTTNPVEYFKVAINSGPTRLMAFTSPDEVLGLQFSREGVVSVAPKSRMLEKGDRILEVDLQPAAGMGSREFLSRVVPLLEQGVPIVVKYADVATPAVASSGPPPAKKTQTNGDKRELEGQSDGKKKLPCPTKIGSAEMPALVQLAEAMALSGLPKTEVLYLSERTGGKFGLASTEYYAHIEGATVVSMVPLGSNHVGVILSETIFHAQGGGQPSDIGQICASDVDGKEIVLNVSMVVDRHVRADSNYEHIFVHIAEVPQGSSPEALQELVQSPVSLQIDSGLRFSAARYHGGGHILDAAVNEFRSNTKEFGHWKVMKGHHFPDGAYVEYKLDSVADQKRLKDDIVKKEVIEGVERVAQQMIQSGAKPSVEHGPLNGVEGSAWARHVTIAGVRMPCGGTHVDDLLKLGLLKVSNMAVKKDRVKFSYIMQ